jgi:hypothetical protein
VRIGDPRRAQAQAVFITPAERSHALIEALYKAEAENGTDNGPNELALACETILSPNDVFNIALQPAFHGSE